MVVSICSAFSRVPPEIKLHILFCLDVKDVNNFRLANIECNALVAAHKLAILREISKRHYERLQADLIRPSFADQGPSTALVTFTTRFPVHVLTHPDRERALLMFSGWYCADNTHLFAPNSIVSRIRNTIIALARAILQKRYQKKRSKKSASKQVFWESVSAWQHDLTRRGLPMYLLHNDDCREQLVHQLKGRPSPRYVYNRDRSAPVSDGRFLHRLLNQDYSAFLPPLPGHGQLEYHLIGVLGNEIRSKVAQGKALNLEQRAEVMGYIGVQAIFHRSLPGLL
ncbi:hypothetical protein LTS10_000809 [Elasticomyces elasticus]|nr:hypothetical protein LTS10_000809 [Elasticomyces elasticus]